MLYEVKTINGVKTKVPLTSSVNSTMPIGFLMANDQDIKPVNYLKCDGSTFDQSIYPGLYLYLGTNVLPTLFDHSRPSDLEALSLTAGVDVTLQYDGELFLEKSQASSTVGRITLDNVEVGNIYTNANAYDHIVIPFKKGQVLNISYSTYAVARVRYYTHPLFIKAVDGVDITDEDAFLGEVKDYVDTEVKDAVSVTQSYSTTEQKTGAYWIDGKPIYRLVVPLNITSGTWFDVCSVQDKSTFVKYEATYRVKNESKQLAPPSWYCSYNSNHFQVLFSSSIGWVDIIIEYTKVAD